MDSRSLLPYPHPDDKAHQVGVRLTVAPKRAEREIPVSTMPVYCEDELMKRGHLILWAVTASLAGFLFGFDTIVISGAEQAFKKAWQLSNELHGLAMGAALWGTVIGAMFGGIPAARYGRKITLISVGFLYFVSAVGSGIAPDPWTFMIARFIGGLGVGAATVASPMFISEIAPAHNRGKLAGMFQFNIVFGILVALVSNALFGKWVSGDVAWRWMLGVEAVPAFIYTLMTFSLPESPRWLITHAGKRAEGAEIFRQINPEAGDDEIERLVQDVEATVADKTKTARFWTSRLKIPILLAIMISVFNQFSGINVVFYFAPRLLGLAGVENPLLSSVSLGVTNLIFTFVGLWLIDKLGRRSLLYVGSIGYIISLGICAYAFLSTPTLKVVSAAKDLGDTAGRILQVEAGDLFISDGDRADLLDGYEAQKAALVSLCATDWYEGVKPRLADEGSTTSVDAMLIGEDATYAQVREIAERCKTEAGGLLGSTSTLVLICLIAFIAAHAVGQGAVIWVFISEIFPNDHRAAGQALGSATHWVCAAGITTLFPIVTAGMDTGYVFAFFCGCMVLQLLWVKFLVPETKGISLEQIEKKLGAL